MPLGSASLGRIALGAVPSATALYLIPDSQVAVSNVEGEGAETTNLHTHIDEAVDGASSNYCHNPGQFDGYLHVGISNTEADFGSMLTLSAAADVLFSNVVDDTYNLTAQVFNASAVALTDAVSIGTHADTTRTQRTVGFTLTGQGTSAGKTEWDGAYIALVWDNTVSSPPDTIDARLYAVRLIYTYTASTGTTVAVGQITETDTAQSFTAAAGNVNISVGQITETDLAQAITAVLGNINVSISQVTETDLAQSITALPGNVSITISQIAETDLAQSFSSSAGAIIPVGQAIETDLAQSIAALVAQTAPIGQAVETDLAQSISALLSQVTAVSQITETDTAFSFNANFSQIIALAQVIETDLAQSISPLHGSAITIGQVTETDTVYPFGRYIIYVQVTESNEAQAITVIQTAPLPNFDVLPATLNESYDIYLNHHPIIDDMQVYEATDQVHTAIHKIVEILGRVDTTVQIIDAIRTITSDDWIEPTDNTILISGATQNVTAYLWPAAEVLGKEFTVKAIDISNPVYLSPYSGDTIDNSSTPISLTLNAVVKVKSDGANWWRID